MSGAANIVSSTFTSYVQKDGRFNVFEIHTDLVALTHQNFYVAGASDNLNTNLATHATAIALALDANEVASNINAVTTLGSLAVPTFVYSTVVENVAALRAAYAIATQQQAVFIGDYLNSLTDVQLETAFGLTAGQVTTLRTNKLTPAANLAASIRATAGQ